MDDQAHGQCRGPSQILQRPVGTAEKPKPLPVGSYYCAIKSREFDKSKNKQTPYVRFVFGIVQPHTDVDPQQMVRVGLENLVERAGLTSRRRLARDTPRERLLDPTSPQGGRLAELIDRLRRRNA